MKKRCGRYKRFVVESLEHRQLLTTGAAPLELSVATECSEDDQDARPVAGLPTSSDAATDMIFQQLGAVSGVHHESKAHPDKAKSASDFSGTWTLTTTVEFGELALTQSGNRVQGSLSNDDVQISMTGKVNGDHLAGHLVSPKTSDHPKIKFKLDATQTDANSMSGAIKASGKGIHQTSNFTGTR